MPATHHSAVLTGAAWSPSMVRSPARPPDRPMMKITRPEISGGRIGRSRRSSGAMAISSSPANSVMPKTSGRPPICAATSDGPK